MDIPCPWCGVRDETEFRYGGQAHVHYPSDPPATDDRDWAAYLFVRDNPKGWFAERWAHTAGCRRWFNAVRHTVTYEIATTYPAGTYATTATEDGLGSTAAHLGQQGPAGKGPRGKAR